MKIKKITTGFVIQTFDTDTGKYVNQEFVAGDQVDYENQKGVTLDPLMMENLNFGPYAANEPYLSFDMVQPKN